MENAIAEIKPNVHKLFLLNTIILVLALVVFIGILFYLKTIIPAGTLSTIRDVGIHIPEINVFPILIGIVILFGIFITVSNYFSLGNIAYHFYKDKMICYKNVFIFKGKEIMIPYSNISRITYHDKFPDTSDVILELSGLKDKEFKMEYIDNGQQTAVSIQNLLNNFKSRYYTAQAQNAKFENILNKDSF